MSDDRPVEPMEEKMAFSLQLIRFVFRHLCPVIFLGLFLLFGSKGDITISFFASSFITIILYWLADEYLKAKNIKFYELCDQTPELP